MKILYGIVGEGLGHATRSKAVIDHLQKEGHEVLILTSNKAFHFLKKSIKNVHEIEGLRLCYARNKVDYLGTFVDNLVRLPLMFIRCIEMLFTVVRPFRPQLVISDFETCSWFMGKCLFLPTITIDNIHVLTKTNIKHLPLSSKTGALLVTALRTPFCKHHFVSTFFPVKPTRKNVTLVPPILRKEISEAKPTNGKHMVVYQTSSTGRRPLEKVFHALKDEQFYVYGYGRRKTIKNVQYFPFDEASFAKHLRSAKAVLCNGGFSLLTESLHLRKPVFCMPIENQYEQRINAGFVQKMGFGLSSVTCTVDRLTAFLNNLSTYRKNLAKYKVQDNEVLFKALKLFLQR